jgi:hypothetical protein
MATTRSKSTAIIVKGLDMRLGSIKCGAILAHAAGIAWRVPQFPWRATVESESNCAAQLWLIRQGGRPRGEEKQCHPMN